MPPRPLSKVFKPHLLRKQKKTFCGFKNFALGPHIAVCMCGPCHTLLFACVALHVFAVLLRSSVVMCDQRARFKDQTDIIGPCNGTAGCTAYRHPDQLPPNTTKTKQIKQTKRTTTKKRKQKRWLLHCCCVAWCLFELIVPCRPCPPVCVSPLAHGGGGGPALPPRACVASRTRGLGGSRLKHFRAEHGNCLKHFRAEHVARVPNTETPLQLSVKLCSVRSTAEHEDEAKAKASDFRHCLHIQLIFKLPYVFRTYHIC